MALISHSFYVKVLNRSRRALNKLYPCQIQMAPHWKCWQWTPDSASWEQIPFGCCTCNTHLRLVCIFSFWGCLVGHIKLPPLWGTPCHCSSSDSVKEGFFIFVTGLSLLWVKTIKIFWSAYLSWSLNEPGALLALCGFKSLQTQGTLFFCQQILFFLCFILGSVRNEFSILLTTSQWLMH